MRTSRFLTTTLAILALMAPVAVANDQGPPPAGAEGAGAVQPAPAPLPEAPPDDEETNTFLVLGIVAGLLALAAGLHMATGRDRTRGPEVAGAR